MAVELRKFSSWPVAIAVVFLVIPPSLFYLYPSSFWANSDYQPLGLADALNFAYRIADLKMYPARGMMDHPGVPFYFMNWLALALAGYPVASKDAGFYTAVIAQVETFYVITIWLGALTGAIGVYLCARGARHLAPAGVVIFGLLVWLVSTPATLLMFVSPSIESFAIVINALFFLVLVLLAHDRSVAPGVSALSAAVGAFAYLNKLSYIYIVLSLAATGIVNLVLRRPGWIRSGKLCVLFGAVFLAVVVAVGFLIIGRDGFHVLTEFHKQVFRGSGMYGAGAEVVVSGDAVWRAIAAIPGDKVYALAIGLIGGGIVAAGGLVAALRGPQHLPAALIAVGAGLASASSAVIVFKHYGYHYTAGVSATLPACVIAVYLLTKDWNYRIRLVGALLAVGATVVMAAQTMPSLIEMLASRAKVAGIAQADMEDIRTHLAGDNRLVEFVYRVPFAEYGEGFVVIYGSVPRLTAAYRQGRPNAISSMTADLTDREVGAFVLDKGYFPTADSIKSAANIALVSPRPATMKEGDRLIELRTTFLLIRQ